MGISFFRKKLLRQESCLCILAWKVQGEHSVGFLIDQSKKLTLFFFGLFTLEQVSDTIPLYLYPFCSSTIRLSAALPSPFVRPCSICNLLHRLDGILVILHWFRVVDHHVSKCDHGSTEIVGKWKVAVI